MSAGTYDHQMKPRLAAGDLAGAISGALDAATIDLQEPADTTEANLDWQMVFIVRSIVFFVVAGVIVTRAGGSKRSEGSLTYSPSGADSSSTTSSGSDSAGSNF